MGLYIVFIRVYPDTSIIEDRPTFICVEVTEPYFGIYRPACRISGPCISNIRIFGETVRYNGIGERFYLGSKAIVLDSDIR